MTNIFLFCTSTEAKSFVHKVLDVENDFGEVSNIFYLVESKVRPRDDKDFSFRTSLKEDKTFRTDFINASPEECQTWALDNQFNHKSIDRNIIVIIDLRSAQDGTISIRNYLPTNKPPEPDEFLPPGDNTWCEYRVEWKDVWWITTHLQGFGPCETIISAYYERKNELTDERGGFDVKRANRLVGGEEPP